MAGDVTVGALQRISHIPGGGANANRDGGNLIAGQDYYNVYFTGGTISGVTLTNTTIQLDAIDNTPIGNTTPSTGKFTTLSASGIFTGGSALGYVDTGVLATFTSNVAGYNQVIARNLNATATASADYVVNNNLSTATTYYGDFGMNSSAFAGSGAFNAPNVVYLTSTTGDLALGTTTANAIHFVVNGGATDAMTISSAGATTFGGTVTASAGFVGNVSGTAATVTGATQAAITSAANLATVGTITAGTWNAGIIAGQYGGTGINNAGKTITLGGNMSTGGTFTTSSTVSITGALSTAGAFSTVGAFAATLTFTAATNVTFPTSGTLITTGSNIGAATATTQAFSDNSTFVATTAFVKSVFANSPVLTTATAAAAPAAGNTSLLLATMTNFTQGANGATLVLLATATASNTGELDFTNIPTGYDQYVLRFTNIVPVSAASSVVVQLGEGAGPTWQSGAGTYNWVNADSNTAGTAYAGGSDTSIAVATSSANAAGSGVSGELIFAGLTTAGSYTQVFGRSWYSTAATYYIASVGGIFTGDTNVKTAIRMFISTGGNISTGVASLYAVRKS